RGAGCLEARPRRRRRPDREPRRKPPVSQTGQIRARRRSTPGRQVRAGMSINPPIDIVLDVAKAADPVRYREAVARLNRAAAGAAFDTLIPAPDVGAAESAMAAPALPPPAARTAKTESTFRDFEAMTLATFV